MDEGQRCAVYLGMLRDSILTTLETMPQLPFEEKVELRPEMLHEAIGRVKRDGPVWIAYEIWYPVATKFRDEPRPKSGLLRVRAVHHEGQLPVRHRQGGTGSELDLHDAVYRKIFSRCGLKFVAVEADSGSMGGSRIAGVHGLHRCGRRFDRKLPSLRLCGRVWRRAPRGWMR